MLDSGKIGRITHVHHVPSQGRNFVMRELATRISGQRFFHLESPWDFTLVLSIISSVAFICPFAPSSHPFVKDFSTARILSR